jgi:DNA segregation ATPase FtsK/SpoIIIE, S-DNA-T family
MARRETKTPAEPRRHDVLGVVFLLLAFLLLMALYSYAPNDVRFNTAGSYNETAQNWAGRWGAYVAFGLFFAFGAAAFLLPPVLLFYGLAYLITPLGYLRAKWPWALVLALTCTGALDLGGELIAGFHKNLQLPGSGGVVGIALNKWLFSHLGVPGSVVAFAGLYLVSFLYLTNFPLGEWLHDLWQRRGQAKEKPVAAASEEEAALAQRAAELEKQAQQLREQINAQEEEQKKSGLGADLQPVPPPNIRDLSVPQAKPPETKESRRKAKAPVEEKPAEPIEEVIPAREIRAATTAEILGAAAQKPALEPGPATAPGAPPAEPLEVAKEAVPVTAAAEAPVVTIADGASAPEAVKAEEPAPAPPPKPKPQPRKPRPIAVAAAPSIGDYKLPPLDFLQHPDPNVKPTETKEELMAKARLMQQTLAQFGIEVEPGDITKGPTITRYELHPAPGVKLEKITALSNNLAAALKAERIHILAPVPGKSSVGIEVPNAIKTKVIMRDLLESEEWVKTKARIPLALGKDVYGHPIIADLAEMPHLLIAGSTGSGKSVCINSIVASLLYKFRPDELRFVMIDPKVVELQQYNVLPHLVVPVVTDPKKVLLALRWVVNEMEKRYQIFARVGVRNIKSFNERPKNKPLPRSEPELPLMARKEKIEPGSDGFAVQLDEEIVVPRDEDIVIPEKLSYVVVIIDELADLMLVAPADVEMAIARITQMARAAGIHCIVATQRPSVDVITGVIKANIPARIAFQVASRVDSRTILDAMGADKLLGKGDMLYLPPGSAKLNRAQGALITDQEIQDAVDFIARQGKPSYEPEIHEQLQKPAGGFDGEEGGVSEEDEVLVEKALEVIRQEKKASTSLLQRRMGLGYGRAARLLDVLEDRGYVGPANGAKPRDILIDLDGTGADGRGQEVTLP